ncbi:16S rRNA (cytosine(967)-C(5))-methyltransferase RsmB [Jeotgalibacillus haloalkalitolerans]|uniref:16S rRNA (cytosine(967)-C(5))-methyltransferase n=1 Tax=Jeotgalibacillus haloalkalitolerans TaxID=3104292 RepID=A0ABU5KK17_9BACL|nr:16S rRNA (cytosine(967)-C(5))-methyltransferase RsmB [Jeotgalibacillus sp. HH7-29]MDZ5711605.1 16S rRNA (cytosine(967)-C(5))-methyltransferase RsmB [Jeotgalibacillus sp. HH7-29]
MSKFSLREAALHILDQIDKNQSYSNLLLNHAIKKFEISKKDTGLLTEITYGTIQRKMTLDYYLEPFLKKKVEGWVRNLLRLSLYQMLYLDRVPERAAIHEAVEIAKKKGHKGISGMVNGVLRSIQREGVRSVEEIQDPVIRISIETSHPEWLVKRWTAHFGLEKTKEMCEKNLIAPVQTARVNTSRISRQEALALLEQEGVEASESPIVPSGIRVKKGNIAHTSAYTDGFITVQDESSMLVAYALAPVPGESVLDMCAAPGGKTTHIAECLNNEGEVLAFDLHEHKIKLIKENADRLKLKNVKGEALDGRKLKERYPDKEFDRILVDAPCSGLGVLRRKPDIKYAKREQDLESLSSIQQELLHSAVNSLKKGGTLVYSTCTVDKEENEGTVKRFLGDHPEMSLTAPEHLPERIAGLAENNMLQIFPQDFDGDGFFIAVFKKSD